MTEEEFVSFIKENQRQFYIMAYHYVQNELKLFGVSKGLTGK